MFRLKQYFLNANTDFDEQALRIHFFVWIVANNLPQLIIKLFFFHSFLQYMIFVINEFLFRNPKMIKQNLHYVVNNL